MKRFQIEPFRIVKITNPMRFERCGYPMSLESATESIKQWSHDHVTTLLVAAADGRTISKSKSELLTNRINKELGYARQLAYQFGGRSRAIHEHHEPLMQDMIAYAISYHHVMAGEYKPGETGRDVEDPRMPELADARRHKIVEIWPITNIQDGQNTADGWSITCRGWLSNKIKDYKDVFIQEKYLEDVTQEEAKFILESNGGISNG